jgi:hypothetical protein
MKRRFQLYLQAMDSYLRIVPLGHVTPEQVEPILGAAQSGLAAFPVVVIDLRDAAAVAAPVVELLQDGLRQLVAARQLVLGLEPNRWILRKPPQEPCRGAGNCQNCRHQQAPPQQQARKTPERS